jgi:hypothetical protein
VARIVGVPQLPPDGYKTLFQEIAGLSEHHSVNDALNTVEPRIRDACKSQGAQVSRSAIHFVLQGFQLAGVDWRSADRDARVLADGFAENVIRLCLNARMELTDEEIGQLRSWITASG